MNPESPAFELFDFEAIAKPNLDPALCIQQKLEEVEGHLDLINTYATKQELIDLLTGALYLPNSRRSSQASYQAWSSGAYETFEAANFTYESILIKIGSSEDSLVQLPTVSVIALISEDQTKITNKNIAFAFVEKTDHEPEIIMFKEKDGRLVTDVPSSDEVTRIKDEFIAAVDKIQASAPDLDEQLEIEELELGVRPYNCLKRGGIQNLGQLCSKSEVELQVIPNFGQKSIDEVKEVLEMRGLSLRSPDSK